MIHMAGEASREADIEANNALSCQVSSSYWCQYRPMCCSSEGSCLVIRVIAPAQGKMNNHGLDRRPHCILPSSYTE